MLKGIIAHALTAAVAASVICSSAMAGLITVTDAEQGVGGGIGYSSAGVDYPYVDQLIPDPPQGPGDAKLDISLTQYGVSILWSLASVFGEDYVIATGSGTASSDWDDHPTDADDVHGGGGSRFAIDFATGSVPVYLRIKGRLMITIVGSADFHPEETFTYVKLSSRNGQILTKIWELALDGRDTETLVPIKHGLWLDTNQNYVLDAYAESGTTATPDHTGPNSRKAQFSITVTFSDSATSDVYFLREYFPLVEGVTRNYLQTYSDGRKNYEVHCVGGTELADGVVTHKEWEFDSGELEYYDYFYECMAWTKEGLRIYKTVASDGSHVTCSPPAIVLPASIRVGQTFRHSCTLTDRDSYGSAIGSWSYSMEMTLEGEEDITVKAGRFPGCLKFSGTEEDEGEVSRFSIWYAPGIGEVRSLFHGTESRELISLTRRGKTYSPGR